MRLLKYFDWACITLSHKINAKTNIAVLIEMKTRDRSARIQLYRVYRKSAFAPYSDVVEYIKYAGFQMVPVSEVATRLRPPSLPRKEI